MKRFTELPDELQIKIFSELPLEDLLKSTVVNTTAIIMLTTNHDYQRSVESGIN